MRNLSRLFLAPTLAAMLLGFASSPSDPAPRIAGSPYDGSWSVAIYTLRGDCGTVRAAVRIVSGRVYSEDQSYRASGGVGANGAAGPIWGPSKTVPLLKIRSALIWINTANARLPPHAAVAAARTANLHF